MLLRLQCNNDKIIIIINPIFQINNIDLQSLVNSFIVVCIFFSSSIFYELSKSTLTLVSSFCFINFTSFISFLNLMGLSSVFLSGEFLRMIIDFALWILVFLFLGVDFVPFYSSCKYGKKLLFLKVNGAFFSFTELDLFILIFNYSSYISSSLSLNLTISCYLLVKD